MPDFVSQVCLQYFPFSAFVTMICWTSTEVPLNLFDSLDSAVLSFCFEQINFFRTFDSISIIFDSLSVGRRSPELHFSYSIKTYVHLTFSESIYGLWLWFQYNWTFSSYGLLDFRRRLPKSCCLLDSNVPFFDFEWTIFCLFSLQLMLVYHLVQLIQA